ncbi:MAG: 4Fe-4S cluster-binding domain-containing protein [Bacteroidales bacterium]|nr:4Fe-4S cluster-binding domain-containing protein [Bacteroides sp.]MCM1199002.1 4Fe-4S cluster-binding domain-containing protein [Clostridium sp.]MCM1502750.1 4Fe-4S cluster-binding domain-containing protein [Bacteroidales bacterium]
MCNLNCVYCYEDKTSKKTFDLNASKAKLAEYLSEKTETGTLIDLHGGEPLIVFSKIKELCEWLWTQDFPEEFKVFCTSNGTLVHGKVQEWLWEHKDKFTLGLSLDGHRQMHNANRSNSFDLIDLDFFLRTWPYQGVKMTISPHTINTLAEGVIFLHERGFVDIRVNLAEMVDWNKESYLEIYRRELGKLGEYYLEHPGLSPCSLFKVPFFRIVNDMKNEKWCGAGSMHARDISGDKEYPCHLFFESVCGKEKSEKSFEIDFNNPDNLVSEECKDCAFLPICPTCYGANYISRGNIAYRDMSICRLHKVRFVEVCKYEYSRIVSNKTELSDVNNDEKYRRVYTLDAIKKLLPSLRELDSSI